MGSINSWLTAKQTSPQCSTIIRPASDQIAQAIVGRAGLEACLTAGPEGLAGRGVL